MLLIKVTTTKRNKSYKHILLFHNKIYKTLLITIIENLQQETHAIHSRIKNKNDYRAIMFPNLERTAGSLLRNNMSDCQVIFDLAEQSRAMEESKGKSCEVSGTRSGSVDEAHFLDKMQARSARKCLGRMTKGEAKFI